MNTATQIFDDAEKGSSLWHDAWLRLRKNKLALFGGSVLLFNGDSRATDAVDRALQLRGSKPRPRGISSISRALAGHRYLWPRCPDANHVRRAYLACGWVYRHRCGTGHWRHLGAPWRAMWVAGSMPVMMRLVDILYALPFMIFIVLLMVVFGRNILLLFPRHRRGGYGLTMARIMRSQVQSLRQQEFVEAAVSVGLSPAADYP